MIADSQALLKPYVFCHCSLVDPGAQRLHCFQSLGVSFLGNKLGAAGGGGQWWPERPSSNFYLIHRVPPAFGAGLSTVILPRTVGKNQCLPLAFWIASVPSLHTLRVAAPRRQLSFF